MILALLTGPQETIAEFAAISELDVIPIDLRKGSGAIALTTMSGATELLLALSERKAPVVMVGPSISLTDAEAHFVRHALEARVTVLALANDLELWSVTGLSRDGSARAMLELEPYCETYRWGIH